MLVFVVRHAMPLKVHTCMVYTSQLNGRRYECGLIHHHTTLERLSFMSVRFSLLRMSRERGGSDIGD